MSRDNESYNCRDLCSLFERYLQAKFIAMKSKEARKKVEEDSRNQILAAFFATEGLRMEVQRRELRQVLDESLASMRSSLAVVEKNVVPTLKVSLKSI